MSKQEPTPVNFWWLSLVIIGYIAFIVGCIYELTVIAAITIIYIWWRPAR